MSSGTLAWAGLATQGRPCDKHSNMSSRCCNGLQPSAGLYLSWAVIGLRSARPIVSVVHSVVRLSSRYLFDSHFLDESRENRAVSYRFSDVNLLRRISSMRNLNLRLVIKLPLHSSSPERRVPRQAIERHTLSWFILPRRGQDFISEIPLAPDGVCLPETARQALRHGSQRRSKRPQRASLKGHITRKRNLGIPLTSLRGNRELYRSIYISKMVLSTVKSGPHEQDRTGHRGRGGPPICGAASLFDCFQIDRP